jgi:hypothetical protein
LRQLFWFSTPFYFDLLLPLFATFQLF